VSSGLGRCFQSGLELKPSPLTGGQPLASCTNILGGTWVNITNVGTVTCNFDNGCATHLTRGLCTNDIKCGWCDFPDPAYSVCFGANAQNTCMNQAFAGGTWYAYSPTANSGSLVHACLALILAILTFVMYL